MFWQYQLVTKYNYEWGAVLADVSLLLNILLYINVYEATIRKIKFSFLLLMDREIDVKSFCTRL